MQLYNNETLTCLCVCVRAWLHYMNGAERRKLAGTNPSVDFMSPVAMAKHEGHKAIGARQRKHLCMTQRESGNDDSTVASLRLMIHEKISFL